MDIVEQFKKDVAEDGCGDVGSLLDEIERLRAELATLRARKQEPVGEVTTVVMKSGERDSYAVNLYSRLNVGDKLYTAPVPPAASAVPEGWRALLSELEWAGSRFNRYGDATLYCAVCGNDEVDGHAVGCRVAAMLAAAPKQEGE